MAETRLRLYTPGDETQILALHRRIFRHTPDETGWRWQFLENPAGPAVIALAERDGQIVGHYAGCPVRMSHQGREYRAARGVDIMVAPEARGAKLSLELYKLALAHIDGPADFHYSTPGAVPQSVFQQLDGQLIVGPTPPIELWLNPAYPLRGKPRWRPVTGTLRALGRAWVKVVPPSGDKAPQNQPPVTTLERFDERCDRLWAESGTRYGLTLLRDARFLNWRYAGPKLVRLAVADDERLYGWLVYRRRDSRGWREAYLLDLVAADEATAERLLRTALVEFRRQGLDVAHAWMMPHAPDWPALRRLGFRQRPPRINLVARAYPGCRLPLEILGQRENWHLTLADTDGV